MPPTAHCSSTVAASRAITRPEGTDGRRHRERRRPTYPDAAMSADLLRSARRLVVFGLAIVAAVGLSGCFTGPRPTLAEAPQMTGDPAADAVLERLDRAATTAFSADYDVLTRFGGVERAVSV